MTSPTGILCLCRAIEMFKEVPATSLPFYPSGGAELRGRGGKKHRRHQNRQCKCREQSEFTFTAVKILVIISIKTYWRKAAYKFLLNGHSRRKKGQGEKCVKRHWCAQWVHLDMQSANFRDDRYHDISLPIWNIVCLPQKRCLKQGWGTSSLWPVCLSFTINN